MKKCSIFFLLLASFIMMHGGAQPEEAIVVTPGAHDFGVIKDDKMIHYTFIIKNRGTRSVKLTALPSSCGCMISRPEPDLVEAGGESKLNMVFQPKGRMGLFQWDARLGTDLPHQPEIVIPLKAYVLMDAILSDQVVNFRIFKRGTQPKITLWMACHKHPQFKLKSVKADVEGFEIETKELDVEGFYPGKQRGYRIDVTPKKDIEYGRNNGTLLVESDIPGYEKLEARIFAYIIGEITAVPDYLSFGVVSPGKTMERKITVSHNHYKPFRVMEAKSNLPFVETKVETVIPEKYYYIHVTLSYPPDAPKGEFRGEILLLTDCASHKEIKLYVQGFVKPEIKSETEPMKK